MTLQTNDDEHVRSQSFRGAPFERRKKIGTSWNNKNQNRSTTRFLAQFGRGKPLWLNGFNLFLPETKENPKKPPNTLFFLVFSYFLFFLSFFPIFFQSSYIVWTEVPRGSILRGPRRNLFT